MCAMIRINRFLAAAGLGSRRACEELIREGRVRINGETTQQLAKIIDTDRDTVMVDGRTVEIEEEHLVLVLHKPEGVLSTVSDGFGRTTVIDLAREHGYGMRLFPVGRLDLNTSGILLLTNDGELAHRLMHPRYKVEKNYLAVVEGELDEQTARRIAAGVDIGGFKTRPCFVRIVESSESESTVEVRIKEGRKRQIRRMFAAFGYTVRRLRRTALGGLSFADLEPGAMRPLTGEELRAIRRMAGLS
jgi:23S rRNA pseudouridine2605 synthase